MNNLSWLIYLADVSGSAETLFVLLAVFGCGGGLAGFIIGTLNKNGEPTIYSFDRGKEADKIAQHRALFTTMERHGKRGLIVGIAAALVATLVPSRGTIYAIAASETGETALKSETGSKAVRALNAWLDRQIAGEEESK